MCRYCHNLYDNGFLAVYKGLLQVSTFINQYDLHYNKINKYLITIYKIKIFIFIITTSIKWAFEMRKGVRKSAF